MINFIIVDDFKEFTKKIEQILTKIMINNSLEYKIHIFDDYNSEFKKISEDIVSNKIYFLDIETKSASGLDIARNIRKNDLESVIIFVTAHEELGNAVARDQLMALTFICKFDDFENRVRSAAMKALQIVGKKKVIKFKDGGAVYNIPINDILYITRDTVERKCYIRTDYAVYKVNKTLSEIKSISDGLLTQTHRSCLINEERTLKIDRKHGVMLFDNGEKIDLISKNFTRELV